MKLKLEIQDSITILCVTEDVLSQHGPILKAGITKLFQSGKKRLLVDLTGATQIDESIAKDIAAIQQLAAGMDAQILVASPVQGIGQAPSREEALKQMGSAIFGLLATEAQLTAQLKKLEQKKAELNEKINATSNKQGPDVMTLRKGNNELQKLIHEMEVLVNRFVNSRVEVKPVQPITGKKAELDKTLTTILGQDGIITVK